ncbi:MAG TPA: hypothetical protein PLU10_02610 [Chitinophagaceae bacterium]|nr:hypothetical protein [Chitinophagaceae bacterium]
MSIPTTPEKGFRFFSINQVGRILGFLMLFMVGENELRAQQRVDQIIPNEEKRKVEHARKLFNNFKIYEGEKILHELIKEHPTVPYYYEALVQLQRQVLDNIVVASNELKEYQEANPVLDTSDEVGAEPVVDKTAKTDSVRKMTLSSSGLDMGILDAKPDKTKRKKATDESDEEPVLKEAVVTIDSSLLVEPLEEESEFKVKKSKESQALKSKLKALHDLNAIPYDAYKAEMIRNAREATRMVAFADSASSYLRQFCVDTINVDQDADEEAQEAFLEGLEDLYLRNYVGASRKFEKAIEFFPLYFSARLKLGDCYLIMNRDTGATRLFEEAKLIQPLRPEPYEKMAQFYYQRGKYNEAATSILEAMLIYPHQHYVEFLARILSKSGRVFESQWLQREVYPASTAKTMEEILAKEKTPWWHYQFAQSEVHGYFDSIGLVRPNEKTNVRYLEVYCWRQMLNKTGTQQFKFARAMDKMDLLDCYVLVTLFHQDLYGQFHDFAKLHADKIRDYFYVLINWEDKKFDKIKKEVGWDVTETTPANTKK